MIQRWLALVVILMSIVGLFGSQHPSTHAQGAQIGPAVFWIDGDYWRYEPASGELTQLTTWGYNRQPMISPDGTHIAYASTAQIAVEALSQDVFVGGGDLPSNIWLLEIASNDAVRIADQPSGASFFNPNAEDKFTMRSTPYWSPDGSKIAWTELAFPGFVSSLAIYDIASGTTQTAALPFATFGGDGGGIPFAATLRWGDMGIVVEEVQVSLQAGTVDYFYHLFAANGVLQTSIQAPPTTSEMYYIDFQLFDWGTAGEFIGILYSTGAWSLIDPSGNFGPTNYSGAVELYNPAQPDGLTVQLLYQNQVFVGYLVNNGVQTALPQGNGQPESFSLAPNGQVVAYVSASANGSAYIATTSSNTPVNTSGPAFSVVWSYGEWRVPATAGEPGEAAVEVPAICTNFLPSRLSDYTAAHTIAPLNLHLEASSTSNVLQNVPAATNIFVLRGPVCGENTAWWNVELNGQNGWLMEGVNGAYTLKSGTTETLLPDFNGAVLAITEQGSPVIAYSQASTGASEVETLFWGDRVLWEGQRVGAGGQNWLTVTLGNGTVAYIQDIQGTVTVLDGGHQTFGIDVNAEVTVQPDGDQLNLRSEPSTYASRVTTVRAGTTMTVVGGPVFAEYFIWWQFELADGTRGWAIDVPKWLLAVTGVGQ